MDKKYKFIVLEGIDGVGKTTIANMVVNILKNRGQQAFLAEMPPQELISAADYMRTVSTKAHFLFYLSIVKLVSDKVLQKLSTGHVICARYVLSTLAYHFAANVGISISVEELSLCRPDISILLTCEDDQRLKRVVSRSKQNTRYDIKSIKEAPIIASIVEQYKTLGKAYNLIEINTTDMTATEVANTIVAMVN